VATDKHLNDTFDNRYFVTRKLGSGGMADVYLAEDQELGRRVALKLLNDRHANDEQFVERFRREAQSAAGLNHPNIVSIFDRGQAEGTYYIAMEYLDGRTLKELLVRNGPPPIPIAIDYSRQILQALSFAHRNGIVHRDIKPHNIVVGPDGRLKVTDFGIARSGASQMTEAGSIVGTAQYLSPEQARGAPVDPRSDLYSLGIVLYEMLTGKVPFTGDAPVEIAMKHLQEVPEPPSEQRPEVPHELDAIVVRALAKDPEQRYQSAEEMDADLARVSRGVAISPKTEDAMTQVLAGAGVTASATMVTRPRAVTPPPAPPAYRAPGPYYEYGEPPRRHSLWPWFLGVLALLIAAGAGYLLYQRIQEQLDSNNPVAVIDIVGVKEELAVQKLEADGFQVKSQDDFSDTVATGFVIDQSPSGGERAPPGSLVTITVSAGREHVTVPAVKGYTLAQAISIIVEAGLKAADPGQVYSDKPVGTVTAQEPAAGKSVLLGSLVHINISLGVKPASVPSVIGQPVANATKALTDAGLEVGRVDVDSDAPEGQVVAQDPSAGVEVSVGSTVTLSVSKGPQTAQVPDVTGSNQADAEALLADAGYRTDTREQPVTDPSEDGLVLAQSPQGGEIRKNGTLVTLTVGALTAVGSETVPASDTPTVETPPADESPVAPATP
jgi:beta-lactam-binding protein with PASTA domain